MMINSTLEYLQGRPIGLFGAGHLGRAIAQALLNAGLPRRQLLLCHRGTEATDLELAAIALADRTTTPQALVASSKIVFYVVRPQLFDAIREFHPFSDCLFVSFLAGTSLERIPVVLPDSQKVRVMTSAPDTLLKRNGIAAIWPGNNTMMHDLLSSLGLRVLSLTSEVTIHAFTALGPCLPIILSFCDGHGIRVDWKELREQGEHYALPGYTEILDWAKDNYRKGFTPDELTRYVAQAATPGGVTDAILVGLTKKNLELRDALECGIRRSEELAA